MQMEAVYYSAPAPRSLRALTLLGLVFDRLIFPTVYVPDGDVDLDATAKELERIRGLPRRSTISHAHTLNGIYMENLMVLALNAEHLRDFCVFTGECSWGRAGVMEPGAKELAFELERAIYGPPPKNFIPMVSEGFAKGLPGGQKAAINGPSWITYPANALLYASRNGYVLVNDNPNLPILNIGSADLKANAKQLATIMALESVKFILPNIRPMSIPELAAFRAETNDLVQPFRQAMLRLSKDLNAAILSDAALSDVQKEARFIVETTVAPELEQLKADLARPSQPWYRRVVDLATAMPEIVGAFATLPTEIAVAKALAKATKILANIRDDQLERQGIGKRGGFHYLLRMEQLR